MRDGCPFCDFNGTISKHYGSVIVFQPLNPVVEGHMLVVPTKHVPDALTDPKLTALVMGKAAEFAAERGDSCNIITSCGSEATQSVFHLHIHVVPRRLGDGLKLPWTDQTMWTAEKHGVPLKEELDRLRLAVGKIATEVDLRDDEYADAGARRGMGMHIANTGDGSVSRQSLEEQIEVTLYPEHFRPASGQSDG